jgi:hypothetical protein
MATNDATMNKEPISEVFNIDCKYAIHSTGEIESIQKKIFLKPILCKNGYTYVSLSCKQYSIHRLVAKYFIPNPQGLPVVNHKNGVKTDNRAENLEWCTHSQNTQHCYDSGMSKKSRAVICVNMDDTICKKYISAAEAEKDGFSRGNIAKCCKNLRKKHGNKKWKYAN